LPTEYTHLREYDYGGQAKNTENINSFFDRIFRILKMGFILSRSAGGGLAGNFKLFTTKHTKSTKNRDNPLRLLT